MKPFNFDFEVPQFNYEWESYNEPTYSPPPSRSEELLYTESHHDMT